MCLFTLLKVKIVGIATSNKHSLAWDENGSLYSWGDSTEGKLGHSIKNASESVKQVEMFPRKIEMINDKYIIMAACGNKYSCAISNKGGLYVWGKGDYKKSIKNYKEP